MAASRFGLSEEAARQHAASRSSLPPPDLPVGKALMIGWRNGIDNQQIFHKCHSSEESVGSPMRSVRI
jgi:hypothetical protein